MVYLIPSFLSPEAVETIPGYVLSAINTCKVIFAEHERTARRYLKELSKEIVIDNFEWYALDKGEEDQISIFREKAGKGLNIAIISEAGCPGIADPGQILIAEAHRLHLEIKPLVGPSSIILALMASGLNGQCFSFDGYLPIEKVAQAKTIKKLEEESTRSQCTKIFIETPYRNNRLMEALFENCKSSTLLCIAAELTSKNEWIKTQTIGEWKKHKTDLHKKPAIFLIQA